MRTGTIQATGFLYAVKDLAAGGGHRFESRGEHTLKGVEER